MFVWNCNIINRLSLKETIQIYLRSIQWKRRKNDFKESSKFIWKVEFPNYVCVFLKSVNSNKISFFLHSLTYLLSILKVLRREKFCANLACQFLLLAWLSRWRKMMKWLTFRSWSVLNVSKSLRELWFYSSMIEFDNHFDRFQFFVY